MNDIKVPASADRAVIEAFRESEDVFFLEKLRKANAETIALHEARYPRLVINPDLARKKLRGKFTAMVSGRDGPELWIVSRVSVGRDGQSCSFNFDRRLK